MNSIYLYCKILYKEVNMKYAFIVFVLLTVLLSCSMRRDKNENQSAVFYPLEDTRLVSDFTDYIDSIAIIPLETSEQSYIASIQKILIAESGKMVLWTSTGIMVFDSAGDFLFTVGQIGRAPGEYLQLYDICLDLAGREILAVDCNNDVLHYSLLDGRFLRKTTPQFPEKYPNCIGIAPSCDGGFFLFGCNPFQKEDFENTFYCLTQFDKNGKYLKSYLSRKEYVLPVSVMTQGINNSYWIRPQEGDNICYCLDSGYVKPVYQLDFKDKYIPYRYVPVTAEHRFDVQKFINNSYYKLPVYLHETERDFYFSAGGPGADDHFFVFDKTTMKGLHWLHDKKDKTPLLLIKASDAQFYYAVFNDYGDYTADSLPDNMEPLKKYLIQKEKLFLDSENSMNPLLVKIRFKM